MKIYIWEGNGISDAYHDDGTLVVLANTPEEARVIVRQAIYDRDFMEKEWFKKRDALIARAGDNWRETEEGKELIHKSYPYESEIFDGENQALDREPDKTLDIDIPKLVAFNGGGYD